MRAMALFETESLSTKGNLKQRRVSGPWFDQAYYCKRAKVILDRNISVRKTYNLDLVAERTSCAAWSDLGSGEGEGSSAMGSGRDGAGSGAFGRKSLQPFLGAGSLKTLGSRSRRQKASIGQRSAKKKRIRN